MDRKQHWERMFSLKGERDVSWFEALPAISVQMMEAAGLGPQTCVLDVGGGDSRVVDALVAQGLTCIAVLDISRTALDRARARIGDAAPTVTWIEADVVSDWSLKPMDIWHDRAVFHFLTDAADRIRYRQHLRSTLRLAGTAIVATFAPDGPQTCSGLPVARYSAETLSKELGEGFELIEAVAHDHRTPWGTSQPFQYCRFRRVH